VCRTINNSSAERSNSATTPYANVGRSCIGRNKVTKYSPPKIIIKFVDNEDEEGVIIFVDQPKAFDRMEWGWLNYVRKILI
jgi:hypothetical protein